MATGYSNESRQICFGLRDAGHEVVFLGCHAPQFYDHEYEGMKIHSIMGTGHRASVQQILASEKPDVFITFWDLRKLMHIMQMDRFIKCPWLMYYLLDDKPLPWEYLRMYRVPQLTIVPGSKFLKGLYDDAGIETADAVQLGTDTDFFKPLDPEIRRKLKRATLGGECVNKTVFGFVGKNMPRKNIPLLMEAFCSLPNEVRKASILMLHTQAQPIEMGPQGPVMIGHDLLNLRKFQYKSDNIIFSGPDGRIDFDMNSVYNVFDYGISATFQEGWGKTSTESMAAGLPMIITDVSTASEICGEDWPFIVPAGATNLYPGVSINASYPSVETMAQKMEEAFYIHRDEPARYQELCEYSRQRILDSMTLQHTIDGWLKVLDDAKDRAGWKDEYMFEEVVI